MLVPARPPPRCAHSGRKEKNTREPRPYVVKTRAAASLVDRYLAAEVRADEGDQSVRVERLAQVAARAARSRALGHHPVVCGDEDDWQRRSSRDEHILKIEAAQPRELDVEY